MAEASDEQSRLIREAVGALFGPSSYEPFIAMVSLKLEEGRGLTLRYAANPLNFAYQRANWHSASADWEVTVEHDPFTARVFDHGKWTGGGGQPTITFAEPESLLLPYRANFWGKPGDAYRIGAASRTAQGYEVTLTPQGDYVQPATICIDESVGKIVAFKDPIQEITLEYTRTAHYSPLPIEAA